MKRLFSSLGSLIRSVLAGTEKQPSDALYRGLPAALVIQEFVVTQVCSVHGGKKKKDGLHSLWFQLPPKGYEVKNFKEYVINL